MTLGADLLRDRRRANAAPGGPHDRLVHFLFSALPIGVGMIVAVMVITPIFPRNEVSFLLDRNKVAITEDRLKVESAMYRGDDDRGRPFTLTAGSAVAEVDCVVGCGLGQDDAALQRRLLGLCCDKAQCPHPVQL